MLEEKQQHKMEKDRVAIGPSVKELYWSDIENANIEYNYILTVVSAYNVHEIRTVM